MVERDYGKVKDELVHILGIDPNEYKTAIKDFFSCIRESREINPIHDKEWEFTLKNPHGSAIRARLFTRVSFENSEFQVVIANADREKHRQEHQTRLEEVRDEIQKLFNIPCIIGG